MKSVKVNSDHYAPHIQRLRYKIVTGQDQAYLKTVNASKIVLYHVNSTCCIVARCFR